VVTDEDDELEDRPLTGAARGQARVVVITDAKPAADDPEHREHREHQEHHEPNLPAPRQPEPGQRSDE
jgi:hypothetical protein